jgi:hypothetical protein
MSNGANPAAQAVPSNTLRSSSWLDHPVAMIVAAAAGAAIIGGILYFTLADTGDEPPIRVQNGSLELYLPATSNKHWKQNPDAKHWRLSGGHRGKDPLDVTIAVNSGANCTAQSGLGNLLTVHYNNGTRVDVHSNNKHAAVDSSQDLTLSTDRHLLTYKATEGFISAIVLDNKTLCTFTDAKQLADLVISDF